MSQPDIEKGKKGKRSRRTGVVTEHRSRRVIVYQNRNKPVLSDVADAVPHFDDDDDDMPAPQHSAARAMTGADAGKATGNPVPPPHGGALTEARVSPPILAGHQSPSSGDHGAAAGYRDPMNVPGPRALALGHPDMRFGITSPAPLAAMRTAEGDNEHGDRSITHVPGSVSVARLDLAGAAGNSGPLRPAANPAARNLPHIAPGAPGSGGPHAMADLGIAANPPKASMKSSEAREMLKRFMFGGNGAR